MAFFASPASTPSVNGGLKGYSDFFASGFRAVSSGYSVPVVQQRRSRRPTSLIATPTTSFTSESDSSISVVVNLNLPADSHNSSPPRPTRRRPLSMFATMPTRTTSPASAVPPSHKRSTSSASGRRIFASLSSRFLDRISFTSSSNAVPSASTSSSSAPVLKTKRRFSITRTLSASRSPPKDAQWISAGSSSLTPSAPNGGPDTTARSRIPASLDPFDSSPDSKSWFIDLSDSNSSPRHTPKRDSFLSMSTTTTGTSNNSNSTSNSSSARSLVHLITAMPTLPPRSQRSSLQVSTGNNGTGANTARRDVGGVHIQEKSDFWILEEEELEPAGGLVLPYPHPRSSSFVDDEVFDDYETRDDAACIDWRQFHNDLLNVVDA
ncbi:hypothetical protein CC1G_06252 [Coprinopsis cinerea okayama7|uniref:Uncharacterized protein n=1 Tax=Coprinopsis cinerea (strain Okayama-7 / 130 / ATCC MYA-4618 / FGSC 9003) TaxID=240176 RepID=A8NVD8_COPC7|nr:hypothetical protein CC1G_06252 [Coprinopsis cinerea okayama7\|eukprot:XP_001836665.1 hypothetical protein CC1G_06252 [Coprinopsis cinerea okayama7\